MLWFEVAFCGSVDGDHHAHLIRREILLAVRENGSGTAHQNTSVDPTLTNLVSPNRLSSLRLDCVDETIAGSLNEQAHAVDSGNDRWRIGRIVGSGARSADPHCLACLFVESHEAVIAASMLPPHKGDAAYD